MKKIVSSILVSGVALIASDSAPIYKSGLLLPPQADLIYERQCKSCHGADGKQTSFEGSARVKYGKIAGRSAAEVAQELKDYQGGVKSKDYQQHNKYGYGAVMRSVTADFSWEEIDAIAEYVSKLSK